MKSYLLCRLKTQKITPTFCIKFSTLTLVFNDKYITVYASTTPQIHEHISYFGVSFISFLYTCTSTASFNHFYHYDDFKKQKRKEFHANGENTSIY